MVTFLQSNYFNISLPVIFQQYLHLAELPELEWRHTSDTLFYRWKSALMSFSMPVDILVKGKRTRIAGSTDWKLLGANLGLRDIKLIDEYYYENTAVIFQ